MRGTMARIQDPAPVKLLVVFTGVRGKPNLVRPH